MKDRKNGTVSAPHHFDVLEYIEYLKKRKRKEVY